MKQLLLHPAVVYTAQKSSPEMFSVKVDQSWEGIAIHWAPIMKQHLDETGCG